MFKLRPSPQNFSVFLTSIFLISVFTTNIQAAGRSNGTITIQGQLMPEFEFDGSLADFANSIKQEMGVCKNQDLNQKFTIGGVAVTRKKWCIETGLKMIELAEASKDWAEFWSKAKDQFNWFKSDGKDGKGTVQFTGYYTPSLDVSRTKTDEYKYPIYNKPNDLEHVTLNGSTVWRRKNEKGEWVKYYDRKELDWDHLLDGKSYEIAYSRNFIDVFFLQIQGAGVLIDRTDPQPDGIDGGQADPVEKRSFVNYAAENGHPYVGIGGILKKEGADPKYFSMQGIKQYFTERPAEIDRVFPMNPSYVFFKEEEKGPFGCTGTVLTPYHSIAVDRKVFPMGAIGLIATEKAVFEDGKFSSWKNFQRVVITNDTGGAIKGAGRVDIYWGETKEAELMGGVQNNLGSLYIAVIR